MNKQSLGSYKGWVHEYLFLQELEDTDFTLGLNSYQLPILD